MCNTILGALREWTKRTEARCKCDGWLRTAGSPTIQLLLRLGLFPRALFAAHGGCAFHSFLTALGHFGSKFEGFGTAFGAIRVFWQHALSATAGHFRSWFAQVLHAAIVHLADELGCLLAALGLA